MNTEDRLQLIALTKDVAELSVRKENIANEVTKLSRQYAELTNIIDQLKVRISELEKR